MSEVQVWVLSGVVGFTITLLLILFRSWLNKSDKLISAINDLKVVIAQQSVQLKTLFNFNDDVKEEIKEHDKRISKIEQKLN